VNINILFRESLHGKLIVISSKEFRGNFEANNGCVVKILVIGSSGLTQQRQIGECDWRTFGWWLVKSLTTLLLTTGRFLFGEKNENVFENRSQVHEESQCMPNVVPVSHSELLHNEMSVVENECAHQEQANQNLNIGDSSRSDKNVHQ